MKRNFFALMTMLLLLLSLSACVQFRQYTSNLVNSKDVSYLRAQSVPSLQLPKDLSDNKIGSEYAIPTTANTGMIPASVISPYASQSGQIDLNLISLEDDPSGYPMIIVHLPLEKTYNYINKALNRHEFNLAAQSNKLHWFKVRSSKTQSQYQLSLMPYGKTKTRILITDNDSKRLKHNNAEQIARRLHDDLTASKLYHEAQMEPRRDTFLRRVVEWF